MSKYKTADQISYDETKKRLENLPERYMIAVEEIVDNLDKDWQNRVIYTKYLSKLCDIFEDAQAHNLSVEDVCGDSIKAYARKFQEEHDFRELDATDFSKVLNHVLLCNGVLVFSAITLLNPFSELYEKNSLSTQSVIFLIIGLIVATIACLLKSKFYKQYNLAVTHLIVSILALVSMVVLGTVSAQGNIYLFVGVAFVCFYDFITAKNKFK